MKEINDLVKASVDKQSALRSIFSSDDLTYKVIDDVRLQDIASGMPEIHRAMSSFCKTNSQTTASLMTLTMLTGGPYRVLRQILAQVKSKISAIREAYFVIREKEVRAKKYRQIAEAKDNPLDRELYFIRAQALEGQIIDSKDSIEAALKELGMYQEAYNQIREANCIPEKWDEADFEKAEVEHHIRCAFRLAIRDVHGSGRLNVATCEYLEAFGISPVQANVDVNSYMVEAQSILNKGDTVGIELLYSFLDLMVKRYKDHWKLAAERIGLKSHIFEKWLYTEEK